MKLSINEYLHEVVVTAIVVKDDKFLITRRSSNKKRFPGKWTVPGGRLHPDDYKSLPKDTEYYWYNVLGQVLRREVKEEVGIEVESIEYLTSLATVHSDGTPSIVISCIAKYGSGEVVLQEDEADKYVWVNLEEAREYDLIDGIYDELVMAQQQINGEPIGQWKRMMK